MEESDSNSAPGAGLAAAPTAGQHLDFARPFAGRRHPHGHWLLLRAARAGLRFEQEPPLLLPLAHEFLRSCAAGQPGRPASTRLLAPPEPLAALQARFAEFPGRWFLFSVRAPAGEWAALAVVEQVGAQVLRLRAAGGAARFAALGPLNLLLEGLHAFGQASGLRALELRAQDLGEWGGPAGAAYGLTLGSPLL